MNKAKFELWDILKDRISGFTGTCLAVSFYATGCIHYGIAPNNVKEDGSLHQWEWIDEIRLEQVKKSETKVGLEGGPDKNPLCK